MDIDISLKTLAKALGKKGGEATRDKYGNDHFKKLSKLGYEARKAKAKTKEQTETNRNANLIRDHKSGDFSLVELIAKYHISAARIYQIKKSSEIPKKLHRGPSSKKEKFSLCRHCHSIRHGRTVRT